MWCADAAAHSHCSDGPPRPGATPCAAALWSISRTVVGGGCDAAALRFSSAVRSSRPVSFGVRSSNVSTSVSPFVSTSISSWDGSMARSSRRQEEAGDGQVDSEEGRRSPSTRPRGALLFTFTRAPPFLRSPSTLRNHFSAHAAHGQHDVDTRRQRVLAHVRGSAQLHHVRSTRARGRRAASFLADLQPTEFSTKLNGVRREGIKTTKATSTTLQITRITEEIVKSEK